VAPGAAQRGSAPQPSGDTPPGAEVDGQQKPVVLPPKLVRFEHAIYPTEAQAQGLEAEVVLKLTIERDGSVSAAEVTEPKGHGFDEAARAAALKFTFEPATRNGEPIRVSVLFPYRFTLTPAPDAAEQPPAPPPDTGELTGILRIAGTDATLAGVEAVVTLPDGSERRVVTDEQGRFRIESATPGRYSVRIATPGFRELVVQESVAAGEATEVVYRLSPETTGIEIIVEGERPSREVTRRTIQRREIERIPGTGGDALRALQSLPGIARPPGLAGFLIVRGSSPNDTNVFADGTLVPLIYHFGGLSSVVPTELLEKIDFYPGNFSARFGRVQGGIVDVGLRSPDTRCFGDYGKPTNETGCYHGMLQLDLIDARTLIQGPIGSSKEWSFALAARRSWIDAWIKPVLESAGSSVTSAPVYYDYQAIVDYKSGSSRLSLRGFGSDDLLEIIVTDPFAQDPGFGGNVRFGTAFYRLQALYEEQLSRDITLEAMLSVGRDDLEFSVGTFLFDIELFPIYLRSEFGMQVMNGVKANFGLDFLAQPYDVVVRAPKFREGDEQSLKVSDRQVVETRDQSTLFRPAWYAELEIQPTERLRFVPGVRWDYARDSGHADFSPRVNARYDLFAGATPEEQANGIVKRRTTLKGGVGMFYQPPEPGETNEVFGTPNLQSNRAVHYALGVEQEFTDQIELSVEGFYKDLTRLVAPRPRDSGYSNDGSGSVIGLETLLKYKPDDRFFGWVAYTLSRSVRKDAPDEEEELFEFDQTHNLIVLGSYRLGRGWEFGARFRLTSGPLATPVVRFPDLASYYSVDAAAYAPIQGKQFSERLPLSHQLDVRLDKRWQFRSWRLSAYLDIQNTYSHPAVEALTYNYDYTLSQYQTGLPIIPSLGLRGEF
ncbi:MAG TPA: TonB-dependent receptor, partial [Polyangiaceae bacterium]